MSSCSKPGSLSLYRKYASKRLGTERMRQLGSLGSGVDFVFCDLVFTPMLFACLFSQAEPVLPCYTGSDTIEGPGPPVKGLSLSLAFRCSFCVIT